DRGPFPPGRPPDGGKRRVPLLARGALERAPTRRLRQRGRACGPRGPRRESRGDSSSRRPAGSCATGAEAAFGQAFRRLLRRARQRRISWMPLRESAVLARGLPQGPPRSHRSNPTGLGARNPRGCLHATLACLVLFPADHPDRLPIVDRVPDIANAWFTSGHYRTGLLMAVATGEALARWIMEGRPRREVEALAW